MQLLEIKKTMDSTLMQQENLKDHFIDNWKHINDVTTLLLGMQLELTLRIVSHDRSKFSPEEAGSYSQAGIKKLQALKYGSEEYFDNLEKLRPAIAHHYQENRHHPEHYENGIEDMNLIDILEMLCDWRAACKKHGHNDIQQSIDINEKRFNLSPELKKILENTIPIIEKYTNWSEVTTQKYL